MPSVLMPEAFLVHLSPPTVQIYYIPATLTPCKVIQILESAKFLLVNPESWALESKIQHQGICSTVQEYRIQCRKTRINRVESRFQDCLKLPYIGQLLAASYVHPYQSINQSINQSFVCHLITNA